MFAVLSNGICLLHDIDRFYKVPVILETWLRHRPSRKQACLRWKFCRADSLKIG